MESQKPSVSPLRQRMLDDMRMRKVGTIGKQLHEPRTYLKIALAAS